MYDFRRIDGATANHLDSQEIDFLQFAFRWLNCLLLRELPFCLTFRLWDTYLAEGSNFRDFLVRPSTEMMLTIVCRFIFVPAFYFNGLRRLKAWISKI